MFLLKSNLCRALRHLGSDHRGTALHEAQDRELPEGVARVHLLHEAVVHEDLRRAALDDVHAAAVHGALHRDRLADLVGHRADAACDGGQKSRSAALENASGHKKAKESKRIFRAYEVATGPETPQTHGKNEAGTRLQAAKAGGVVLPFRRPAVRLVGLLHQAEALLLRGIILQHPVERLPLNEHLRAY